MLLLNYPSSAVKQANHPDVVADLDAILAARRPTSSTRITSPTSTTRTSRSPPGDRGRVRRNLARRPPAPHPRLRSVARSRLGSDDADKVPLSR